MSIVAMARPAPFTVYVCGVEWSGCVCVRGGVDGWVGGYIISMAFHC